MKNDIIVNNHFVFLKNKIKFKNDFGNRLILLTGCIILTILRETDLLIFPRFWAEEGQLFYPYASHHTVWEVFTTPQVGYLTLFNSIVSAIQTRFFSIESAPMVSTYFGFIVQLIPVCIILFTSYILCDTFFKKAICSLIFVIMIPPEMWLNTTNSHFIFGIITFLIMVVPASELSKINIYIYRILLIIGTLTGPASMFLTPVFLLKASNEKSREKYIQAAIFCFCAIIQATVLVHTLMYSNHYQRLQHYDINLTLLAFFTDNFSLNMNRTFFGVMMAFYYVYLFIRNRKRAEHSLFIWSFLILSIFSTLGSLNMQGAPRYSFIPTCIFMLLIAFEFFEVKLTYYTFRNVFSITVFLFCFFLSFLCYKYRMQYVYNPFFPKWKDELAKQRLDHHYNPKIHPSYLFVKL